MSDTQSILYSADETKLLSSLIDESIVKVELDSSIFVNLHMGSGRLIYCMPDEVWASSKRLEEVGYSWVKRACLSEKPYTCDVGKAEEVPGLSGRVREIFVLQTCVVFQGAIDNKSEIEALKENNIENYAWIQLNPDYIGYLSSDARYSLVEVGFLIETDSSVISIATFDNSFNIDPLLSDKEKNSELFKIRYKVIPINGQDLHA